MTWSFVSDSGDVDVDGVDPAAPTVAERASTTTDAHLGDDPPTNDAPSAASPAEPGEPVDPDSPLLAAYPQAMAVFESSPENRAMLQDHLAMLTDATGVEWSEAMLLALGTSYCNDWPRDLETGALTDDGELVWASAVAPVIGIEVDDAVTAIRSRIWAGYQFVCE